MMLWKLPLLGQDDGVDNNLDVDAPAGIYISAYHFSWNVQGVPTGDSFSGTIDWSDGNGGTGTGESSYASDDLIGNDLISWPASYWPQGVPGGTAVQWNNQGGGLFTNSDDVPFEVPMEHCDADTNYYGIGTNGEPVLSTHQHRTADTKIMLNTGGKGVAGGQSLWVINVSATNMILDLGGDDGLMVDTIDPSQITVNGKRADSSGNVYLVLPDGDPPLKVQANGSDYYTFSVNPTKYTAHFEVFVRMPDPGGTANHTGSSSSGDYGHAWWCLSSDAPSIIVSQQLSVANLNPSAVNQLNVQEGYGHSGSLSIVYFPFDLIDTNGVVYGSSGDNTNRTYQIGFNELLGGLNWVQNLVNNPGTYRAIHNNCAEKVEQLGNTVGVPLPNKTTPEELGNNLPPSN